MKKSALDHWIEKTEALPGLSRKGLDALQLERLNETLARVSLRDPRYPPRVASLAELKGLPFTTPQMLAENPGKFLLTSQSEVSRVISGATSGTTGAAKRVFYTEKDIQHTVGFFAAGISEMLQPGEKCLICFPFSGPFGLGDLIAQAVEALDGIPIRSGFGQSWGELTAVVRREQPQTYIGFPVPLLSLARVYGSGFPIRRALVSGDACPEGVMAELEALLGNPLYPHYGSRECGLGGAVTCTAFQGMHIRENHIIPEIIDEDGNVLPEGEYGELVITTIGMEAMPLIRYRTGDYTRILPQCPCGSITRRIGRVTRKETPFPIHQLDSLLFRLPELIDYRAFWENQLVLQAVATEKSAAEPLLRLLRAHNAGIAFSVETVCFSPNTRPLYPGKRHLGKSAL